MFLLPRLENSASGAGQFKTDGRMVGYDLAASAIPITEPSEKAGEPDPYDSNTTKSYSNTPIKLMKSPLLV